MTQKNNLLIAQVEPPQTADGGDYYYRTYAPGIAMAREEGVWVINLTNVHRKKQEIMSQANVLILKNIIDPDILPLIDKRKSELKVTVYEIADDLNALQPWNPVYELFKNSDNISTIYRLVKSCDALQVTVPELKKLYGYLNDNCEVFPNQILNIPAERPIKRDDKIIVGWGGSHGHLEDIEKIAQPLMGWIDKNSNVCLHLMCSEPIWDLFKALPENRKRYTAPGSIDDYYIFLSEINIGIAPLKDTAFNRSRSDIKSLEYAVSGVVPVMAHLAPYLNSVIPGRTGFLFRDHNELINILDKLIATPEMLQEIAGKAREYVLRERCQLSHGKDRVDFYRDLGKHPRGENRQEGTAFKYFEKWSKLEGAVRDGRHLNLLSTHFETLLHDGLVAMQMDGDNEQAKRFFEQASKLEPTNYLPYLFGSSVSHDPLQTLRKAIDLMPDSIKSWILLGQEYSRKGELREAFKSIDSAAMIYPGYEIPYLKAANMLKSMGQKEQSEILFQKAESLKIHHP